MYKYGPSVFLTLLAYVVEWRWIFIRGNFMKSYHCRKPIVDDFGDFGLLSKGFLFKSGADGGSVYAVELFAVPVKFIHDIFLQDWTMTISGYLVVKFPCINNSVGFKICLHFSMGSYWWRG